MLRAASSIGPAPPRRRSALKSKGRLFVGNEAQMKVSPKNHQSIVVVIDDDPGIREALEDLIHSVGLQVETFASVQEFLDRSKKERPGCLILDVRLPGRSGLDF